MNRRAFLGSLAAVAVAPAVAAPTPPVCPADAALREAIREECARTERLHAFLVERDALIHQTRDAKGPLRLL